MKTIFALVGIVVLILIYLWYKYKYVPDQLLKTIQGVVSNPIQQQIPPTTDELNLFNNVLKSTTSDFKKSTLYSGLTDIKKLDVDSFINQIMSDSAIKSEIINYARIYNVSLDESIKNYIINKKINPDRASAISGR